MIRDPERGEERKGDLRGEKDGSRSVDKITGDSEARNDFLDGNYVYRHHVDPGVKLHVLKEESCPKRHLRCVDVTRRPNTLDVLQESRMDDYRNTDGDRNLTLDWFHAVHRLGVQRGPAEPGMHAGISALARQSRHCLRGQSPCQILNTVGIFMIWRAWTCRMQAPGSTQRERQTMLKIMSGLTGNAATVCRRSTGPPKKT